ncbi:MAG: flavin reductase family protein [Thermoanaerobaculia bacterium]|nr:flavin reductase family protein [Thermoanaerobaculia bacterium]
MPISSEAFRDALRLFPAGVTLVTTRTADGRVHGMTVSAFASVSPKPPLIVVSIDHSHTMHGLLQEGCRSEQATFGVNILAEDQQHLSNRFAFIKDEDRFDEGIWTSARTGAPILADALAWLDCRVHSFHQAGTHTLYVGEVEASKVPRDDQRPLVYWNRGYRHLREPHGPSSRPEGDTTDSSHSDQGADE